MACLFTESGAAARKFRHEVEAGNIGINIGVAAPTAPFPFSGARESFFGDLHGQGHDAVDFFLLRKRSWSNDGRKNQTHDLGSSDCTRGKYLCAVKLPSR